ncbi:MAG: hypothetical protein C4583_03030 [Anaerolineaceae bacterium]|nr:MAG: hypothetical protein C4583_03030 [Anaerolineaceae bacterium]
MPRHSIRSSEGYLLVDHSNSPGLPENFYRDIGLGGFAPNTGEGKKTEGATVDVTSSVAVTAVHASLRITGAHASAPPEQLSVNVADPDPFDPPSLTPSWGALDTLWLAIISYRSALVTVSAFPANHPNSQAQYQHSGGTGTDGGIAIAARNLNATSNDPDAYTVSATSNGRARTVAIRPEADILLGQAML